MTPGLTEILIVVLIVVLLFGAKTDPRTGPWDRKKRDIIQSWDA